MAFSNRRMKSVKMKVNTASYMNGLSSSHRIGMAIISRIRFIMFPPALYNAVGILSKGRSGGVSRHCPPVPAIENRFTFNAPSIRMNVRLNIRNDTNLYPESRPNIRCPVSCAGTIINRESMKLRMPVSAASAVFENGIEMNFDTYSDNVMSVKITMPAVEIIKPTEMPMSSPAINFRIFLMFIRIYTTINIGKQWIILPNVYITLSDGWIVFCG